MESLEDKEGKRIRDGGGEFLRRWEGRRRTINYLHVLTCFAEDAMITGQVGRLELLAGKVRADIWSRS